ncbi:MAG: GTPase Era [Tissierellia bacterium]|nr:GTPase Era [Tissierellia bacterium]
MKSGFIAVIGRPNVGKSTLLNGILGEQLSIISNKAQTTRNKIRFIHTEDRGQLIFLDTPGVQKPRNKLGKFLLEESLSALNDVDLILHVVDPSGIGPKEEMIFEALQGVKETPVLLIINKMDTLAREELLPLMDRYRERYDFKELIPVSALKGEGLDHLVDVIFQYMPEGPLYFPDDMVTDQSERFIVAEKIREKCLKYLEEEVPHGVAVAIEEMKMRPDGSLMDIGAIIYVERDSHKGIIIGKNGSMLKRIGTSARRSISAILGERVNLQLWVKVSKNWREKAEQVARFGYRDEE